MELILHSSAGPVPKVAEVSETLTVREVLVMFATDEEGLWIEETDVELELDLTLEQAGVKHRHHVHHHRCRRVKVIVRYIEDERAREFSPAATVGRVLEWALGTEAFNIPIEQRPEYGFLTCGDGSAVASDTHLGSLTGQDAGCDVCLSLVRKINPQG